MYIDDFNTNLRCAKILVPHPRIWMGKFRLSIHYILRAHGITINKAHYKQQPGRRQELLLIQISHALHYILGFFLFQLAY